MLRSLPVCRVDSNPSCAWSTHGFKHFPFHGMTRDDTRNGSPARYLEGVAIAMVEAATVREWERHRGEAPMTTEYLRAVDTVIGWDDGLDAVTSYVECTSATYHGRPMHAENPKTRGGWTSRGGT